MITVTVLCICGATESVDVEVGSILNTLLKLGWAVDDEGRMICQQCDRANDIMDKCTGVRRY